MLTRLTFVGSASYLQDMGASASQDCLVSPGACPSAPLRTVHPAPWSRLSHPALFRYLPDDARNVHSRLPPLALAPHGQIPRTPPGQDHKTVPHVHCIQGQAAACVHQESARPVRRHRPHWPQRGLHPRRLMHAATHGRAGPH